MDGFRLQAERLVAPQGQSAVIAEHQGLDALAQVAMAVEQATEVAVSAKAEPQVLAMADQAPATQQGCWRWCQP